MHTLHTYIKQGNHVCIRLQQQNSPKKGAGGREGANHTQSADLGRETQQNSNFWEMNSQKEKPIPRNVIATLNRGDSVQNPELGKLNGACRTGKAAVPRVVEKVKSGIRTKIKASQNVYKEQLQRAVWLSCCSSRQFCVWIMR